MPETSFPEIHVTANALDSPLFSPTVEVVRPFSNAQPALLRLGVTNEDTARRTYLAGVLKPFADVQNDAGDEYWMFLNPADERGLLHDSEDSPIIPSEFDGRCWRINPRWGASQILEGFRLESVDSITNEYMVLAAPDTEECPPPDDYHFETTL